MKNEKSLVVHLLLCRFPPHEDKPHADFLLADQSTPPIRPHKLDASYNHPSNQYDRTHTSNLSIIFFISSITIKRSSTYIQSHMNVQQLNLTLAPLSPYLLH